MTIMHVVNMHMIKNWSMLEGGERERFWMKIDGGIKVVFIKSMGNLVDAHSSTNYTN